MGYDKTPSSDRRIFVLGVSTAVLLLALMPILRSYFYSIIRPIEQQRIDEANGRALLEQSREGQEAALAGVSDAIASLGQRGRTGAPAIAPRRSEQANVDAVEGWAEAKNEAARRHAQFAFDRAQEARRQAELAAQADAGVPAVAPTPAAPAAPVATP